MPADLRYPIGKFEWVPPENEEQMAKRRIQYTDVLAKLPSNMRAAVEGLNAQELDTPYRPDGWTVRQVVHHVPESHMNAYVRLKLALTEDNPTIRPYDEKEWAKLPDVLVTPVEVSLQLSGGVACALGRYGAPDAPQRLFPHPHPPGTWNPDSGSATRHVCVAFGPPYSAYHVITRAHGMETERRGRVAAPSNQQDLG